MRVAANGIEIEVDDRGPADAEPLVLIMGLGMQLVAWPDELVDDLLRRGFRVIRFDNRDAGLSSGFDRLGMPNLAWAMLRHAMHLPVPAPYRLADMAADTMGLIDALGLGPVHLCGASMGGMIAQHLAAGHPDRVRSLTLLMTTSGARRLPQAAPRVRRALLGRPDASDPEAVVRHLQRVLATIGSPAYPPDPDRLRERLQATVRRAWRPAGTMRQLLAVVADGDRTPLLRRIRAPTRVIHGEDDPLVPVAAGRDLVDQISGAEGDFIPGMGHDLPLPLLPRLADGIAHNARRVR
ncbi:MAG: alpha/beta fold hydrolase [Pseudomonadota bacterium]|nr:alpha/beta fold hydrolase [Rubrivivax sp.]MCA3259512.1 alpha/beta fold hydrolase [Rubrivivax sp.]MCZ8030891.1 alpha/beta hydrolase [Rubrivivax sp.]